MLHRAILGSVERFMGVMIENTMGKFPTWMAPTQVVIIPISDKHAEYAKQVAAKLSAADIRTATGGLRVTVDSSNERMQKKILIAQQQKIPYMLVVGDKEKDSGTAAVRLRNGTDMGAKPLDEIIARLKQEVETRQDMSE